MLLGKEKRAKLEVVAIDLKNFPVASQLPNAPSVSKDTFDLLEGRLGRHRDEFRRMYNESHRQVPPLSVRTEEIDAIATALSGIIPVTKEYVRLNETLKNLEQISRTVQGDQVVYWMGVIATFDGSNGSRVLVSSVKEGTKNFSWASPDLSSNISLPVAKCFPHFFHQHASVAENRPLRFFLSHHWKPRDERTISSGEDIASTLAYAELPFEDICFGNKPRIICSDLPLVVNGRKLDSVSGGERPCMNVRISISLER